MMEHEVLKCYTSKRNQVYLVKLHAGSGDRLAVMKKYREEHRLLLDTEYENMKRLKKEGILVPEIIYKGSDSLVMEHVQGDLAADLAEKLDTGDWIDGLALWMAKLHRVREGSSSLLKRDVNLRNFIYSNGKIYGLDFESTGHGDGRTDLGNLCFFLLTNSPSFKREKYMMTRQLLCSYEGYSGKKPEAMGRYLLESRAEAKIRRVHNRMNILR